MAAAKRAKAPRKPARKAARTARQVHPKPPARRAVGRAGTAGKAEGDEFVQAHIESLPAWQREMASRFDGVVEREVPDVRKAIKWSMPFYGVPGQGWFASVGGFSKHLKVNFFRGTSLRPVPPSGASKEMRSIDLREDDEFPEFQLTEWVRQAARLSGWGS